MLPKGLLRVLLGITNVLFFIAGGTALGVGVWYSMDKLFIADIIGTDLFSAASYLFVFCGACIVILAFVGCAATVFESKKMLILYLFLVILILIVFLSAAIIAAVFQGELTSSLVSRMQTTMKNSYGNQVNSNEENRRITEAWNFAQKTLRCCAVNDNGYGIYRETQWYRDQVGQAIDLSQVNFIPISCCVYLEHRQKYQNADLCQRNPYGPPNNPDPNSSKNDHMYYEGCLTAAKNFGEENAGVILAIGFGFSIVFIAGIVLSILLLRQMSEFDPVSTKVI
ncbi:CD82 antigen-like [Mizuhopecten yessoensis]|uniref:CD82 antigen-like n=1 Tax=Mizuhopecten yessoensis TaxID=6573 RepID=UPI000B45F0EB|nr:CD82 antigen-like [Mizuhopecten yessoensis]